MQGACSVLCFCSQSPACAPGSSNVAAGFLGVTYVQNLPHTVSLYFVALTTSIAAF